MLSILIPVRNESDNLDEIHISISKELSEINYGVLIINDFSEDDTLDKAQKLFSQSQKFKVLNNKKKGLGGAINLGIKESSGSHIVIMMADQSDDFKDLINYVNLMNTNENYDAILGSRFLKDSKVINYPIQKLILNRIFNIFIKLITHSDYNDFTNAFKIYRKETLNKLQPFVSDNFNIFLEMPLKLILNNYKYKIIPINWSNRKFGKAKFKINELGSKYIHTLYHVIKQTISKKLN